MSAILDPLYGIVKIQFEIRNQRPRKPPNTELCENRRISKISYPPYWIRHFEKWKSDVKFVVENPKSPGVRSSTKIVGFPKYYVRHFKFRKFDVKFIISDPKSFRIQSFAEIVWFPKLHIRHIGYLLFCEGYDYLRSVRLFFPCSSTTPITVDHS